MYTYNVVVMRLLKISEEIEEAVRTKKPVGALESTLISHGLPSPLNIEVAAKSEKILRDLQVSTSQWYVFNVFLNTGSVPGYDDYKLGKDYKYNSVSCNIETLQEISVSLLFYHVR